MSDMFNDEEEVILSKTMRLRERMIDGIATRKDEDLPKKPSEIMAVTTLLESMDRSVLSKAKLRQDERANKGQEASRQVLLALMTELHQNKTPSVDARSLPGAGTQPVYSPQDSLHINSGELIPRTDHCLPEE